MTVDTSRLEADITKLLQALADETAKASAANSDPAVQATLDSMASKIEAVLNPPAPSETVTATDSSASAV